jgi:hypothetical protein
MLSGHEEVPPVDEPRRRGPGRPKGSKNKPKPTGRQRAQGAFASADEAITANLPLLVDVLIKNAVEDGDVSSARYLIDRALGKPNERKEIAGEQRIIIETKDDWRS